MQNISKKYILVNARPFLLGSCLACLVCAMPTSVSAQPISSQSVMSPALPTPQSTHQASGTKKWGRGFAAESKITKPEASSVASQSLPPEPKPSPVQKSLPTIPPKAVQRSVDSADQNVKAGETVLRALLGSGSITSPDLSGTVSSTRADYMEPLRLDEAVSLALKNNKEIQSFMARRESAGWDRIGAYARYIPSVEFTYAEGAETSEPGSYNGPDGSRVTKTTHHRRDRSLFVRQTLLDAVVIAEIIKSGDSVAVADVELRDSQEQTSFETLKAFFDLLEASEVVRHTVEYRSYLEDLLRRMRVRVEGGAATAADLDRIEGRILTAESAQLQALSKYGLTLSELKRLTGVAPAQFALPTRLVPSVPSSPQEALALAVKANPSYQASLKRIDVAQGDRNRFFADAVPRLSAEMSSVYNYNAGGAAHGDPIDGVYPNQKDTRFMLVARWNLNAGTAVSSGMSGVAKVREMKFKSQDVLSRIEEGVWTSYEALTAARRRITINTKTFEANKRVVRDLEEQVLLNDKSLFELLDAHDRYYASRVELVKAVFAEAHAAYQIRSHIGEVTGAVIESAPSGSKAGT